MVPPRAPSFGARNGPLVRSGESAVSPPRAGRRSTIDENRSEPGPAPDAHGRRARVALATCAEIPDGDDDFPALIEALAGVGVDSEPAVWDADVDWSAFDLVVLRSTWDYAERRDEFLAWARSLPRVLNGDRRPRMEHGQAAIPDRPGRCERPNRSDRCSSSRGSRSILRESRSSSSRRSPPADEARRGSSPRRPMPPGRSSSGFTPKAGRRWSSPTSARPRRERWCTSTAPSPMRCSGAFRFQPAVAGRSSTSTNSSARPPRHRRIAAIAEAALACAPGELVYARVDLMGGAVLELEATEPSLYLEFGVGAAARLAAAIERTLRPE